MKRTHKKQKTGELKPTQIAFIEAKVRALGSVGAVRKYYVKKDRVGAFARLYASYLWPDAGIVE